MAATSAQAIRQYTGPAILERGYRPFFLGATLFAALAIPVWVWMLSTGMTFGTGLSSRELHIHEMVFGYPSAVIAGFLLTATPNWTGRLPVIDKPLAGLFLLWFAGRAAMTIPFDVPVAASVVDCAFLVVFAGLIYREILAAGNKRNLPICVLVSLIAIANISFHVLAARQGDTDIAVRGALGIVAVMLMLIGGRVIPSFTRNWLASKGETQLPAPMSRFDYVALATGVVAVLLWIATPQWGVTAIVAIIAGLVHLIRLARWRGWKTLAEPLVTILHIGYLWLPVWFVLLGTSIMTSGWPDKSVSVHALTAGAIGTMTVAVMSRAILGHSGRRLHAGPATVAIYALIASGAILRIFASAIPLEYTYVLAISGGLWSGGFALFVWVYGPMCVMRRRKA